MALAQEKPEARYTYADVLTWDERERYELLDGEALMMATPSRIHQKILGELFTQLHNFLKGKPCEVYPAPFGVRLFPQEDNSDDTFFEPDITVVCDPSKLDDRGCNGPPDMVVDILSPSTAKYDLVEKLNKYRLAGVRECWFADPEEKIVQAHIMEGGEHKFAVYEPGATAPVRILPGCQIDLKAVFAL
ncbi:MAG: Uma2 family endonuclease [Treponema sp.]|jgi:Uma2 family endonuclease|nr:Uma2 family endonuclease [Treponema sp.]